jgi:hypothetical protein
MRLITVRYFCHFIEYFSFIGTVTLSNAVDVQPYRNTMETIQLQGRYIRHVMEHSVTSYDTTDPDGGFLQVSGKMDFNKCNALAHVPSSTVISCRLPAGYAIFPLKNMVLRVMLSVRAF